ncbi:Uu.00g086340.m01.CDS01 [Anthostomella pinea]|uniref:Uu.00g086340.m01.CDS01 n=1 Tax=Anthostomella pinea TaxID=933095 RepID=A0AAI8VGQ5_9PEZI|nr:Uu.00g086340.m01.CDS01 [Anthostomella pinea]
MVFFKSRYTRAAAVPRATAVLRSSTTIAFPHRPFASKTAQATQGQASPGTASNVGSNPGSASAEQQQVRKGRASGAASSPDSASVATPVSKPSEATGGQHSEEDTDAQAAFKQDPDKSGGEKRRAVEEQGQKPLDPADK